MAKRIFKVIGIVLASIVGFIGAVVGVLAIMGKFKKPVVYPKQLVFADQEMIIVDNNEYEDNLSKKIFSFELKGLSGDEQEVTEKNCLLTINSGSSLIQLCDVEGNALTQESNGKYKILCNENTYFRLKKIEDKVLSGSTYGRVTLRADDEKMMTGTARNQDLVVWIDRKVEDINIDDSGLSRENVNNTRENGVDVKELTLGLEESLMFDAVSTPKYALNPISKDGFGGKIVEYFYFKPGAMTDWAMLDKTNLSDYPFLTYDATNDKIYFKANTTDLAGQTYCFRLGVFATYAERDAYLESIAGASETTNLERMGAMVWSQFNVVVKSTKITSIGSETTNVSLSLFETTNNVILNEDKEGYQNLRLYMIGAGTRTSLRFDESDFDLRTINLIKSTNIEDVWFKNYTASEFASDSSLALDLTSKVGNTFIDFFVYNNKSTDPNYQSYRLVTPEEFDYIATYERGSLGNGRSFNISVKKLPELEDGLQLVLGVMVVNNTGEYYLTSIDVSVAEKDLSFEFVSDTQSHTLNINYLKQPSGNDYYVEPEMLAFDDVVSITAGSYRACVFVTPRSLTAVYDIEVVENIIFEKDTQQYVLVGYFEGNKFVNKVKAKVGAVNNDTKLYMLQLKNSYSANFATESYDAAEQYINSIVSRNIEDEYRIEAEASGDNAILLNKDFVSSGRMVVVNVKYVIDDVADVIDIKNFANTSRNDIIDEKSDSTKLVAGFEYTVRLTSPVGNEMLTNLYYANAETFKQLFSVVVYDKNGNPVEDDLMFSIIDVEPDSSTLAGEGETYADGEGVASQSRNLILTFSINENADSNSATNPHSYRLKFKYDDVEIVSNIITVESNRPTNITLSYVEGGATEGGETTPETPEQGEDNVSTQADESKQIDIELNNAVLYVNIGLNSGDSSAYKYTYTLVYQLNGQSKTYTYTDNAFRLNKTNEVLTDVPIFNLTPNYRENTISYSIAGREVENLEGLKVGEYTLSLTSYGNLSKQLTIVVQANVNPINTENSYFSYETTSELEIKDKSTYKLNGESSTDGVVRYKYVENSTETYLPGLVNISNVRFNFSGSESLELVEADDGSSYTLQTKNEIEGAKKPVLTIARDEYGDWTFERLDFLNTRLVITLKVDMDTISAYDLTLTFTSSRQIDMNKNWTNIYADTKLKFYDQSNDGQFASNALFQITDSSASSLTFDIFRTDITDDTNYGANFETSGSQTLPAGIYRVVFKTNSGETLATFENIQVKPNVFATLNNGNVKSDLTNINLADILTLSQYNTTKVYGEDASTSEIYSADDLIAIEDYSLFSLTCDKFADKVNEEDAQTSLITLDNGIVTVGYVKDLNASIVCTINLKYDGIEIGSFDLTVVNKYAVQDEIKNEIMVNRDNLLENISIKDSTIAEATDVTPTTVTVVTDGFSLNSNIIQQNISEPTYINVVYTFDVDGKTYTYSKQIKLISYVPKLKETANSTYSENASFDIINDVFDVNYNDNVISDANIKNIYVEKVLVDGEENYTYFVVGENVKGVGYKSDTLGTSFATAIGKIVGNNKNITIVYHIDYDDTSASEYSHVLTILNNQTISSNYPFNSIKTSSDINLVAVNGKAEDVKGFGSFTDKGNNIYAFASGLKFEPATMGQVMDFEADASLDVRRANIVDASSENGTIVREGIEKVELIAYESNQNARIYANGGYISINGSIVTFNPSVSFNAGASAYFLFKITTTSGNFSYYLVRLHKQSGNFADLTTTDFAQEIDAGENINIIPSLGSVNANCRLNLADETNLNYYLLSVKTTDNNDYVDGFDKSAVAEFATINQYGKLTTTANKFYITNPNKFVQIKVAIVYTDNNKQIYIGSYTTNISVTSNLNIYDENTNPTGLLRKTGSLGHYKAYLTDLSSANVTINGTIATAQTVTITSANSGYLSVDESKNIVTTGQNAKTIITLSQDAIQANSYLTTDLAFTVCYSVAGATIYVDYSFAGVSVDQIGDVTLGNFDKTTGFDSTLNLNNRLGGYVGNVEYSYTNTGSTATTGSLADENKTIDFVQTNATQVKRVTLTLTDLFDLVDGVVTREFNVTIYPAYYIEQGDKGGLMSSAYQAIKNTTNQFNTAVGSSATFTKSENGKYTTYIAGGLSIYVGGEVSLKYSSADFYNYILKKDTTLIDSASTEMDIADSDTINFVHLAQEKTIKLTINLFADGEYIKDKNDTNKAVVIDFYVTLPATYINFEANYTVKNSNHDNFVAGSTQSNILAYLFGGETGANYSARRLTLVYQNKKADGSFENLYTTNYDANKMGFFTENNPNVIDKDGLTLGEAMTKTANGADFDINFNKVSADTQTWLKLSNNAGLEGVVYSLNIMVGEKDKLVYATGDNQDYVENHSAWGKSNQFASVLINDTDSEVDFKYSSTSKQTKIAKIYDVRNNVMWLGATSIKVEYGSSQATGSFSLVDGKYVATVAGYTITIYRNDNREILFDIERQAGGNVCRTITVSMNIYTNAGLLCENFSLNIFNYTVSTTDKTWYATEQVELGQLFNVVGNDGSMASNLTYDLLLSGESTFYYVNGEKVVVNSKTNKLFEYNDLTKTLITYQVPEQVLLTISVEIKYNNVLVCVAKRIVTIDRNVQFKVNGEAVAPGSQFTTTYELGANGHYSKSAGKVLINNYNLKDVLTLSFVKTNQTITMGTDNTAISISKVEVSDYWGNQIDNYVSLDKENLVLSFARDFSGEVTLSLGYKTNSGYFTQYWTITVVGLQTVTYLTNPTNPKVNNGSSFKSGDLVEIVSTNENNNPALKVTENIFDNSNISYNVYMGYKVLTADEFNTVDMAYLQGLNNSDLTNMINAPATALTITRSMPIVPQSKQDNTIDYYVVFKIVYTYIKKGDNSVASMPYFAIYKVNNVASVTLAQNVNTNINVDQSSNFYDANTKQLKLFYYEEVYGENTIKYLGSNQVLINGSTYDYTINNNVLTAVNGKTYKFDYTQSTPTLTIDTNDAIERSEVKSYNDNSMYNCDYANLLRFKDFIDTISLITLGEGKFTSSKLPSKLHCDAGMFYITLTENETEYLFTNSIDTQIKIFVSDNNVAMQSDDVSLTGNNSISAKGSLWISQIFQNGGYGTDYEIVGITSSTVSSNWAKNAEEAILVSKVNSFTIDGKTYEVYQALFKDPDVAGLYQVTANYYVLLGTDSVYAVDYRSKGESNCFRVKYEEGKASSIDITDAIKLYQNNGNGELVAQTIALNGVDKEATEGDIVDISKPASAYICSISEADLISYKQTHQQETSLTINLTLKYSVEGKLQAIVRFDLPELTFVVEASSSDVEFDLNTLINNFEDLRSVTLYDQNNRVYIDTSSAKITKSAQELAEYKQANPTAIYMKVNYRLTYTTVNASGEDEQVTIDFAVRYKLA